MAHLPRGWTANQYIAGGSIPRFILPVEFPITFGRYQLIERLAVGGMAEIYLAKISDDDRIHQTVVIKRLLPHMADDPQFNAMFLDEAKLCKRLNHPNIVKTYEFGRHDDELFIAMEFVDGLDALAVLRECAHRKVRMPTEVAVYIAQQVLNALDHAHNQVDEEGSALGVVHRDVSPSNVLLSRRGEVKLVDFGIARAAQQNHKTRAGTLKGKYGYMSPEQVVDGDIDARSDIFSVGIVLAELLTGRRLFAAANELDVLLMVRDARLDRLERYGKHLGMDLGRILRKAMSKKIEDRFESGRELSDTLGEWMSMKGYQVTPLVIAQIVESLYRDAWQRKRDSMEQARENQSAVGAVQAAVSTGARSGSMGSGRVHSKPMPNVPRFVDDDLSEPTEIEGIPSGKLQGPDSLPMVSIERTDGVVAYEMENLETNRLPGFDRPVQEDGAPAASAVPRAVHEHAPAEIARSADYEDEETLERSSGEIAREHARESASPDETIADDDRHYASIDDAVDAIGDVAPPGVDGDTGAAAQAVGSNDTASGTDVVNDTVPFQRLDTVDVPGEMLEDLSPDMVADSSRDFDGRAVSIRPQMKSQPSGSPDEPDGAPESDPGARGQGRTRVRLETQVSGEPDDTGNFAESPPIAVFYRLAVSRATGLLVVAVGGVRKHIYFRNGIPEYVSSNVATELFGEYLVKCGAILPGELSMALAVMPQYHGKLGDTLVALGLLKPLEVFRHLTKQVRSRLIDVCTWFKGQFAWYGGQEHQRDAFPLDLNTFDVLGAGALALPMDKLSVWANAVAGNRPTITRDARTSPELFRIGPVVDDVCNRLDGTRTVTELRGDFNDLEAEARFLRVLYLLIQTDLASFG